MRTFAGTVLVALLTSPAWAQDVPVESIPPDSPRWQLEGQAKVTDFQGRKALFLDGGAATLDGLELRDGVIDVDVATQAVRGFFGLQFRMAKDGATAEWFYLRAHKSGAPDAMQYTPVLHSGANWQLYNGPGFTGAVDIPRDTWMHLRVAVTGAQAKVYINDMDKPVLDITDLKCGLQTGYVALHVLKGPTYYSNFTVKRTPDAPWVPRPPAMPAGTLVKWSLSPSYDALARDLEKPLSPAEMKAIKWEDVEAEAPGTVMINRFRDSPHPQVTFANDFSKRLDPQPGMSVVYARTSIVAERAGVRRLSLGYSDDVSVFLNGQILYRGRSAQSFRDPAFLGIVNPENDTLYLPLKKGPNELVLAVSELGGGWGFIARLSEMP